MDGVYFRGRRIATKKALKEMVRKWPADITIESTSMFGGYSGPLREVDKSYTIVGPDPYTSRKWFANIEFKNGSWVVV